MAGNESTTEEKGDGTVVEPIPFETTDEMASALYDATKSTPVKPEDFIDRLADKLASHGGTSGGVAHVKTIKRHNWVAVAMATLLGPGGAIAVIYATSDRAKSNSIEVEHLKKAGKEIVPRIEKTEDSVNAIKVKVETIDTSMNAIETSQAEIATGIQELKRENVNRLKSELADAKRELRKRSRDSE